MRFRLLFIALGLLSCCPSYSASLPDPDPLIEGLVHCIDGSLTIPIWGYERMSPLHRSLHGNHPLRIDTQQIPIPEGLRLHQKGSEWSLTSENGQIVVDRLSFTAVKEDAFICEEADGRRYEYLFILSADGSYLLSQVTYPDETVVRYHYDEKGRLLSWECPEILPIDAAYDDTGRVKKVQQGDRSLCALSYHNDWTEALFPSGKRHRYHYTEGRLTAREEYIEAESTAAYRTYRYYWHNDQLIAIALLNAEGLALCCRAFGYDIEGRVNCETLYGNLSGTGKRNFSLDTEGKPLDADVESYSIRFFYDTSADQHFNLKSEENGTSTRYRYDTYGRVLDRWISDGNEIQLRLFSRYDEAGNVLLSGVDDGYSEDMDDYSGVTQHRSLHLVYAPATGGLTQPLLVDEKHWNPENDEEVLERSIINQYGKQGELTQRHYIDANQECRAVMSLRTDACGRIASLSEATGDLRQWRYDGAGNETYFRDAATGYTHTRSYDSYGRLIAEISKKDTDTSSATQNFSYDQSGQLQFATDRFGHRTDYLYDALGRCLQKQCPATAVKGKLQRPTYRKEYDELDHIVRSYNPLQEVIEVEYTVRGTPSLIHYPDGTQERYHYNLDGSLAEQTSRTGQRTRYERDFLGRVVRQEQIDLNGQIRDATVQYDTFGVLHSKNNQGIQLSYTRDPSGRVTAVDEDWGEDYIRREYLYNSSGQLRETLEWSSNQPEQSSITQIIRDDAGNINGMRLLDEQQNLILASGQSNKETSWEHIEKDYDCINNLGQRVLRETRTDTHGAVLTLEHNPLGQIVLEEWQDTWGRLLGRTHIYYDLMGNRTEVVHEQIIQNEMVGEQKILYRYGPLGRLEAREEHLPHIPTRITSYHYDARGQLSTMVKPDQVSLTFVYDSAGRQAQLYSSDNTINYKYEYDDAGHLLLAADANTGKATTRQYSAAGFLTSETLSNGLTIHREVDSKGRTTTLDLPDQSSIRYTYDCALLRQVARFNNTGDCLYRQTYDSYTAEGRPDLMTLPGNAGTIHHSYDDSGRLVKIDSQEWQQTLSIDNDTIHSIATTNEETRYYAYDAIGRLTQEQNEHYSYDSLGNPLGTKEAYYDENGNLYCIETNEQTYYFHYDALDRLISAERPKNEKVVFSYDPIDRRIQQVDQGWDEHTCQWKSRKALQFLYDCNQEIGACNPKGELSSLRLLGRGLHGEQDSTVAIEINGKAYAAISDFRGSIAALADLESGSLVQQYSYDAYGVMNTVDNTPALSPWLFCGTRYLSSFHLHQFGRRDYLPVQRCWMTPDPMQYLDGPNRYCFARCNPIAYHDPQGWFALDTLWEGAGPVINFVRKHLSHALFFASDFLDMNVHMFQDIVEDFRFMAQQVVGPTLFLLSGLGGENVYFGVHGNGEFNDKVRVSHTNGILNDHQCVLEAVDQVSQAHGGINVHYTFRPSAGWPADPLNGLLTVLGFSSPTSQRLAQGWKELITEMGGVGQGGVIIHYAHSLGSVETFNARERLTEEEQKMVRVTTFGSPMVLPNEGFQYVHNYISKRDGILLCDAMGYFYAFMKNASHVTFLGDIGDGLPLVDHGFSGPSYYGILKELGRRFVAIYDPSQYDAMYVDKNER